MHEKIANQQYNKFCRSAEAKKRYGYKWRKLRSRFLEKHPLCEMCKRQGRYTAATEVHHILPLSEGGTHDEKNLMPLCKSCHSAITITATNKK